MLVISGKLHPRPQVTDYQGAGASTKVDREGLAALAAETGLEISVCHLPPGTSKWNKIEHRLFSQITRNWRGRPLNSLATIINLIGSTTTSTGLTVTAHLDTADYPTGIKISDEDVRTSRSPATLGTATGTIASTQGATRPNRPDLIHYDPPTAPRSLLGSRGHLWRTAHSVA